LNQSDVCISIDFHATRVAPPPLNVPVPPETKEKELGAAEPARKDGVSSCNRAEIFGLAIIDKQTVDLFDVLSKEKNYTSPQ
jgi:hypothetical protein